jgi:hypothetical protein
LLRWDESRLSKTNETVEAVVTLSWDGRGYLSSEDRSAGLIRVSRSSEVSPMVDTGGIRLGLVLKMSYLNAREVDLDWTGGKLSVHAPGREVRGEMASSAGARCPVEILFLGDGRGRSLARRSVIIRMGPASFGADLSSAGAWVEVAVRGSRGDCDDSAVIMIIAPSQGRPIGATTTLSTDYFLLEPLQTPQILVSIRYCSVYRVSLSTEKMLELLAVCPECCIRCRNALSVNCPETAHGQ